MNNNKQYLSYNQLVQAFGEHDPQSAFARLLIYKFSKSNAAVHKINKTKKVFLRPQPDLFNTVDLNDYWYGGLILENCRSKDVLKRYPQLKGKQQ